MFLLLYFILLFYNMVLSEDAITSDAHSSERIVQNGPSRILEFKDDHYKLDMGLSKREKESLKTRIWECLEQKDGSTISVKRDWNGIIFLEHDLGPDYQRTDVVWRKSYVWEKIWGIADKYIWDQHFNSTALEKLSLQDNVCKNINHFLALRDTWIQENSSDHVWFINRFFSKENKLHLPGSIVEGKFRGIGTYDHLLLCDRFNVNVCKDYSDIHELNPWEKWGYSIRLLKTMM